MGKSKNKATRGRKPIAYRKEDLERQNVIVVVCGEIMTMPGLPRVPSADSIKLNEKGEVEGLF